MTRELRPFLLALIDGDLKRVSVTFVRKRDGIHVEALAFTGNHTFACASFANVHRSDKTTKVTLGDVLLTSKRRLDNLWAMLGGQEKLRGQRKKRP